MKVELLPRSVPLPEVEDYTDRIEFRNLGLPLGFDDEKMLVNLRAFQLVQIFSGLGSISIDGSTNNIESEAPEVASISSDGTASAAARVGLSYKALGRGTIQFPSGNSYIGDADATVTLDTQEIDRRLSSIKNGAYLLSPKKRAKYFNSGVSSGLTDVNFHANIDRQKSMTSILSNGVAIPSALMAEDISLYFFMTMFNSAAQMAAFRDVIKDYRISFFPGYSLDRHFISQSIIFASKFMRGVD